jgi:hypothetical protein
MAVAVNVATHPNFTIDEFLALTNWEKPPTAQYKQNMAAALEYFQRIVPRNVLRQHESAPWVLPINGIRIKLTSWMQGIAFHQPVNAQRRVNKGDPLIAFKGDDIKAGVVAGCWYTFPSTRQGQVAIHSTLARMHKFKAKIPFACLHSKASDAYVGWLTDVPAEYRHGGADQLFVWNAGLLLEPA